MNHTMNPLLFGNYGPFPTLWQSNPPLGLNLDFVDLNLSDNSSDNQMFSNPFFSNALLPGNSSPSLFSENSLLENSFSSNTFSPLSQIFSGFDFNLLSTPLNSQSVASPVARNTAQTSASRNSLTDLLNTSQQDSVYSSLLTSFNDLFNTVNQIAALKK